GSGAGRRRGGFGAGRNSAHRPGPAVAGMRISGRFVLLVLAGVVPLFAWPTWTCALSIIAVLLAVLIVDVAVAASPRQLTLSRAAPTNVRLSEAATATLTVRNASRRTFRGVLRDAWPPSA